MHALQVNIHSFYLALVPIQYNTKHLQFFIRHLNLFLQLVYK